MNAPNKMISIEYQAHAFAEIISEGTGTPVEEVASRAIYAGLDLVVADIKRGRPDRYGPLNKVEEDDHEERMDRRRRRIGKKRMRSKIPKDAKHCTAEELLEQANKEDLTEPMRKEGVGRSFQRFWPATLKFRNQGMEYDWIFDWCAARDDYLTEDRRSSFVSSMSTRYRKHQKLILSYSELYRVGLRLCRKLDAVRSDPDYNKAMAYLVRKGNFEAEHDDLRKLLKRAHRRDHKVLQFDEGEVPKQFKE